MKKPCYAWLSALVVFTLSGFQYAILVFRFRWEPTVLAPWNEDASFGVPLVSHTTPLPPSQSRFSGAYDGKGPLNVVVIYPDDWRHDSLEDARPGLIHTPFLSQLAKEGIRFTHNAVTASVCWLSRATLFTGRYASQHMSLRPICPIFTDHKWWKRTWPYKLMQEGGYWVGHIGKWQYRNDQKFLQNAYNWSSFHEGEHWVTLRDKTTRQAIKRVHTADLARDDAIQFLRERPKDRPFAVTVAFYPPKPVGRDTTPGAAWSPKRPFYEMYRDHEFEEPYNFSEAFESLPYFLKTGIARERFGWRYSTHHHYQEGMKRYYALVSQVDQAAQGIIDELKAQGVYNRTLIIFTTDNGVLQGAHGLAGKWHPYEESIRTPLIIRDPRMPEEKQGTLDDSFTLNIDLAQTILGAAGIKPSSKMQGRDIAELYIPPRKKEHELPWRQDFYYELPLAQFPASAALVTKEWKYVKWPDIGYEQLFHLTKDPYELTDLRNESSTQQILDLLRRRFVQLEEVAIAPGATEKPVCKPRLYDGS